MVRLKRERKAGTSTTSSCEETSLVEPVHYITLKVIVTVKQRQHYI